MRILGIETSCDETGIGIYEGGKTLSAPAPGLLAHALYSQAAMHAPFGGVVPELASRDHIRKVLPLISETLEQAGLAHTAIDGIAYTAGPGLVGALMVGAAIACSLSLAWEVPNIPVHHIEAHLLAVMLESPSPAFPFLALLVSGGHTLLIHVDGVGCYRVLGESLDDAVGEAFDKTAKLLGLGYPGGPAIAKLAEQGDPERFVFPRPMLGRPGLDFSFSGLKTAVSNTWQQLAPKEQTDKARAAIARAFEEAVVEILQVKCRRALKQTGLKRLVLAGGVAANQRLRATLNKTIVNQGCDVFYPRPVFCTDNGAMVAYAGWVNLMTGRSPADAELAVAVYPRWPLPPL